MNEALKVRDWSAELAAISDEERFREFVLAAAQSAPELLGEVIAKAWEFDDSWVEWAKQVFATALDEREAARKAGRLPPFRLRHHLALALRHNLALGLRRSRSGRSRSCGYPGSLR